jgi:putative DNA primase/helicase
MTLYSPTRAQLAAIPAQLKTRRQFVLWYGRDRANHPGKLDKIPVNPYDLEHASTTDALTWGTFDQCVAALETALEGWHAADPTGYRGGGIGYVFTTDDPYVGIDLDGCVNDATWVIEAWAQAYVDKLKSYTEVTPSQTGLHILAEGSLPPGGRRKGAVEMYSEGRFFTLTGWHLDGTPETIEPRHKPLEDVWAQLFGHQGTETDETTPPTALSTPSMPDNLILSKLFRAKNNEKFIALWEGRWRDPGYPSPSEADLALCGIVRFYTQESPQIDRFFRQSGMMRPKWDEKRGDSSYGERTIRAALATPHEHYTPPPALVGIVTRQPLTGNGPLPQKQGVSWGTAFPFSNGKSTREIMRMMRVAPRFLVEKLVPDGLTVLAAPAKSYKSYFSLSLALATIGEGDWCETFPVESNGPVVFFGLESPMMQFRNRIHQLRPDYKPENHPYDITFFSGMKSLPSFKDGLQPAIEQVIEHYKPRLIVIDPLSYLYRLGRHDDLASATLDLLWPLADMAEKAQVAIFAPEHMRKRSKEDVSVVDQLAGSHIKAAVVHGLLMLHRQGDELIIETIMRDAQSQELSLALEFDNDTHSVTWGYKGSNDMLSATRLDSLTHKVHEELRNRKYPMKVSGLIESLDLPNTDRIKGTIRKILNRAQHERLVESNRRGEYFWIEH